MDNSGKKSSTFDKILNSPVAGIAPWIIMALLNGPGRFELSVGLAFGLAALVLIVGALRGNSPKMLEFADVIFFGGLGLIGILASDQTIHWLENWAGEVSNVALVVIAIGSIALRTPFTVQYARQEVDKSLWHNPGFMHINYVLTWFWAGAFVVQALAGLIGDAVLDSSNNIWTGWVIQTFAIIVAIQFTSWYPEVAQARGRQAAGEAGDPPPPLSALFIPLAGWLVPIGVISLIFDAAPTWVGVGLIVLGVVLTHSFVRDGRNKKRGNKSQHTGGTPHGSTPQGAA